MLPTLHKKERENRPRHLTVYYATQTGTSDSFARQLEREGPEHGFLVSVVDLEDIDVQQLVEDSRIDTDSRTARAVFLTATYGEGEAPDNAVKFVQTLKEKAGTTEVLIDRIKEEDLHEPEHILEDLEYCVFGLGNKQYDHFNAMGKFFDFALHRLGASRIIPTSLGDDDDDIEADFEAWKEKQLWPTMESKFVHDSFALEHRASEKAKNLALPSCPYVVEFVAKGTKPDQEHYDHIHTSSKHFFTASHCPVKAVRELRKQPDGGSTVHIEIDISGADGLEYATADNLGVMPSNDRAAVEFVAKRLGYDLDAVFVLKAAPNHEWHGTPFPMPITVRECLTNYCDLTGAPRRSDLKLLAAYATDPMDQKALNRMASSEGRAEYKEKILDGFVGLTDLLKLCPSIHLPLEHFLSTCDKIQTRYYTISSSSSVHPNTVHLTVSVTEAPRKDGSKFKGLCSNYLASCVAGKDTIRVFNRPSTFRLPEDSTKPIIMIGPGTGIAPMRAFLQERQYQRDTLKKTIGMNVLYFGCRNRAHDFIYEAELQAFAHSKVLDKLYLAFSREQSQKLYVQHLLLQNATETWNLINDCGAYVYTCGAVKMGHDVTEALKEIVVSHGKLTADAAKEYINNMSHEGRFIQELWA